MCIDVYMHAQKAYYLKKNDVRRQLRMNIYIYMWMDCKHLKSTKRQEKSLHQRRRLPHNVSAPPNKQKRTTTPTKHAYNFPKSVRKIIEQNTFQQYTTHGYGNMAGGVLHVCVCAGANLCCDMTVYLKKRNEYKYIYYNLYIMCMS